MVNSLDVQYPIVDYTPRFRVLYARRITLVNFLFDRLASFVLYQAIKASVLLAANLLNC